MLYDADPGQRGFPQSNEIVGAGNWEIINQGDPNLDVEGTEPAKQVTERL
jgi:hypothetical protein